MATKRNHSDVNSSPPCVRAPCLQELCELPMVEHSSPLSSQNAGPKPYLNHVGICSEPPDQIINPKRAWCVLSSVLIFSQPKETGAHRFSSSAKHHIEPQRATSDIVKVDLLHRLALNNKVAVLCQMSCH